MKFRGLLIEFLRIYSVRSGQAGIVIFHRAGWWMEKKKRGIRARARDIKI